MNLNLSNSFGQLSSPSLPVYEALGPEKGEQERETFWGRPFKAEEVELESGSILPHFNQPENPELFKIYRYHRLSPRGPVTEEEYQIFTDIFEMLSSLGYFGLFKKMGKIEKLKGRVGHIHPFNFLETLVINPDLKKLFMLVQNHNAMVWSKCRKNFKEEVELQNEMGNVKPHLSNFSKYMQVHPLELCTYLNENEVENMMAALLKKHSS